MSISILLGYTFYFDLPNGTNIGELACKLQIHLFTMSKCSTRLSLTIW